MKHILSKHQRAMGALAVVVLFAWACQKKFDPSSYMPSESFNGYSYSRDVAPSNLIAYWAFNNSMIDSVSGTFANNAGATYGTGIVGQGLQCGLNQYAVFPITPAIQSMKSGTFSYWVNTPINNNGIQEAVCIVDSNQFWGNLDLFFDGQSATGCTMKIQLYGNGANEVWLTSWTLANPWSTWQHLVLTYDDTTTTFNFYVNGVLYQNGTLVGTAVTPSFTSLDFSQAPTVVFGSAQFMTTPSQTSGATSQSWGGYLAGVVDEVRFYNRALTPAEISALYKLELLGR
jgi:hypothetical protein